MTKKQLFVILISLVGLGSLFVILSDKFTDSPMSQVEVEPSLSLVNQKDKIWVISDTHYLSDTLHDDGEKFEFIKKTAAGKDLDFPRERLEALIWQVQQERPKVLIVSGDLTLNGEYQSAKELADYFKEIEALGTAVYVIPGNHDIADGWAQSYQGKEVKRVKQILPGDFAELFAEMGYEEAISRDKDSLSYAVKPFEDLLLVMIDTNKYINDVSRSNPTTSGKLRPKTSDWLETVFTKASQEGLKVIPVMHHNLIHHNAKINQGFTIDKSEEVQEFFGKHGVEVVLTGHIHAQDIASIDYQGRKIYDIATGSFASLSNSIGELKLANNQLTYQRQPLKLTDWARETNQKDVRLLNYDNYSQELFRLDGEGMAHRQIYEENWYEEESAQVVAEFVGRMNNRYFDGFDYIAEESQLAAIKKEAGYQLLSQQPESFLLQYIETILADWDTNDVEVQLPLNPLTQKN